jgi:hypothetical protein
MNEEGCRSGGLDLEILMVILQTQTTTLESCLEHSWQTMDPIIEPSSVESLQRRQRQSKFQFCLEEITIHTLFIQNDKNND